MHYCSECLWWKPIAGFPMQPRAAVKNSYTNTSSHPKEPQTKNLKPKPTFKKKQTHSSLHIFRQKLYQLIHHSELKVHRSALGVTCGQTDQCSLATPGQIPPPHTFAWRSVAVTGGVSQLLKKITPTLTTLMLLGRGRRSQKSAGLARGRPLTVWHSNSAPLCCSRVRVGACSIKSQPFHKPRYTVSFLERRKSCPLSRAMKDRKGQTTTASGVRSHWPPMSTHPLRPLCRSPQKFFPSLDGNPFGHAAHHPRAGR